MADTRTLDQRIREQARQELKDRIEKASEPISRLRAWSAGPVTGLFRKAGNGDMVPADSQMVFKAFCDHLFAENVERAESDAIAAFLQRVDSLQEQVNELRDLSHEH